MTLSEAPPGKPRPGSPLKLLVFAGVPPPVHGQAVMVAALLAALRTDPAFSVVHVDPRLSHDTADVGRWRPGKLLRLAAACGKAIQVRLSRGPMVLYYVPAPGRRVPVFRDWIAMACCRPFFSGVILHWHAVGLGAWIEKNATAVERRLTRFFLGRATLALVLAPELADDAAVFTPRHLSVVPNGIPDPLGGAALPSRAKHTPMDVLFLGLGSEAKGLFRTLDAVLLANAREPGAFRLTFAGAFASTVEDQRFRQAAAFSDGLIQYAGFADETKKAELLRTADVFCFPTTYAHEGQPLVLLEALAYDLPIITTRWRSIPSLLPTSPHVHYVDPERPQEIADALFQTRATEARPAGELRRHFLAHFTLEQHLRVTKEALQRLNL